MVLSSDFFRKDLSTASVAVASAAPNNYFSHMLLLKNYLIGLSASGHLFGVCVADLQDG